MNTTGLIQEVAANTNHTAYYGNPAGGYKGSDSGEPFTFLNFFAVGTPITSIVLSNSASSGFESDNWTFRTAAYGTSPTDGSVLPGIAVEQVTGHTVTAYTNNMTGFTDSGIPVNIASVPEPSSFAMFAIGGLLLGGYAWRKKQRTV